MASIINPTEQRPRTEATPETTDLDRTPVSDGADAQPASRDDRSDGIQSVVRKLSRWLESNGCAPAVAGTGEHSERDDLDWLISHSIVEIDRRINAQINAILHHPKFQRIEASWRGLWYLVDQLHPEPPPDGGVRVRVLNVSKNDLQRDFESAFEFDQSELFKTVYSAEFDMPGGKPYGVLLGDYEFGPRDLELLEMIRGVAAASFAPFVAQAAPSLLDIGMDDYNRLADRPFDPMRAWQQPEFIPWRSFREHSDSRFIGLTLPRVLMRTPYTNDGSQVLGCSPSGSRLGIALPGFSEDVSSATGNGYLWGSSAYVFGGVLIRAFQNTGWFTDIRGAPAGGVLGAEDSGGLVTDLASCDFKTDAPGGALRPSTDIIITDELERKLDQIGLIPLCRCKDTSYAVFYGTPSVQKPQEFEGKDGPAATANARLSAMLQYILCASRFAHYIKVMWREKIGSPITAGDLEQTLNEWLSSYKNMEFTDGHPLADGNATVHARPDRPGVFDCEIFLQPHVQFDAISASVYLRTEGPANRKR